MSTTCSLGLIIVHLLRLAVATGHNVLISGEAIRKACPLYSTQGSPDFVGVFRIKNENRITIKHFENILNGETANSCVFYDTHTHIATHTQTPNPDAYASQVIKN